MVESGLDSKALNEALIKEDEVIRIKNKLEIKENLWKIEKKFKIKISQKIQN
jgi:hypothetical protein